MSVKRKVKKSKRFIKTLVFLGVFVYVIYILANQSVTKNNNNAELDMLHSQAEATLYRQQEYKAELERVGTPEYMEEIARSRYGLVMPNEIILIDVLSN